MPLETIDLEGIAKEQTEFANENYTNTGSTRERARRARNTGSKTSYDEVVDKISNWGEKTQSAIGAIGGIAGVIGNAVQNFKNGANTPTANLEVKAEVGDSVKFVIVLLIAFAGIVLLSKRN